MYPRNPSLVKKCQWCLRQTDRIEKGKHCHDQLCDRCVIKDSNCQSNCPICWEKNICKYLNINRICSGKRNGLNYLMRLFFSLIVCSKIMKNDDRGSVCSQKHFHCSECLSGGCLLCQFHQIQARNDKTYRDLPAEKQQALYSCQVWEKKYEEGTPTNCRSSPRFFDDNNNHSEKISGSLTFC